MNYLPPCTFNDRVCIWDTIPIFFHQFRLVDRHDSCSFIGGHTPLILEGLQWWVHTRKLFYPGHVGVFPKPMVFWACWIPDRVAAGQLLVKFFSIPVIVHVPSGKHTKSDWTWTIEIVDLPIQNGGSFHSYVNVYQRVDNHPIMIWLVVQFHHLEKWWSSSMFRMTSHIWNAKYKPCSKPPTSISMAFMDNHHCSSLHGSLGSNSHFGPSFLTALFLDVTIDCCLSTGKPRMPVIVSSNSSKHSRDCFKS